MKFNLKNIDDKTIFIFRLMVCLTSWSAIFISTITAIYEGTLFNHFSYFTIQTNLFIAIWLTIAILYANKEEKPIILGPMVRGAITVYITVTFLIFAIILSSTVIPTTPTGIYTNAINHYIVPIAFIVDWVITEMENEYKWTYVKYWLSYPIIFAIYSGIRGLIINWYPYFFIDIDSLGIFAVFRNIIIVSLFVILLGSVYTFINRWLYNKRN